MNYLSFLILRVKNWLIETLTTNKSKIILFTKLIVGICILVLLISYVSILRSLFAFLGLAFMVTSLSYAIFQATIDLLSFLIHKHKSLRKEYINYLHYLKSKEK